MFMKQKITKTVALIAALFLGGCSGTSGLLSLKNDAQLLDGPPVQDVVTPFDRALACLRQHIAPTVTFAVGAIVDETGKEQVNEGGTGKFVTQGAGDIVQSALFRAGATTVNRRDPRIMETEAKWGIRDARRIVPANYYITGSINSLDFLPGGGFDVQVAGAGPKVRQYRMLIGLDLALTEAKTGRIVANVPLQKQVVAKEVGIGVGRFFGETLVSVDIGANDREALNFALRNMLNLAVFELLTQVMQPKNYIDCRSEIDRIHGILDNSKSAEALQKFEQEQIEKPETLVIEELVEPLPRKLRTKITDPKHQAAVPSPGATGG
jgi:curli biogenesis system outer membrane secretion channel CsgG